MSFVIPEHKYQGPFSAPKQPVLGRRRSNSGFVPALDKIFTRLGAPLLKQTLENCHVTHLFHFSSILSSALPPSLSSKVCWSGSVDGDRAYSWLRLVFDKIEQPCLLALARPAPLRGRHVVQGGGDQVTPSASHRLTVMIIIFTNIVPSRKNQRFGWHFAKNCVSHFVYDY